MFCAWYQIRHLRSLSLSLSLPLSLTHTHTHTLPHTQTHTHCLEWTDTRGSERPPWSQMSEEPFRRCSNEAGVRASERTQARCVGVCVCVCVCVCVRESVNMYACMSVSMLPFVYLHQISVCVRVCGGVWSTCACVYVFVSVCVCVCGVVC